MQTKKKNLTFAPRSHDATAAAATILRDSRMRRLRRFAFSIIIAAIAVIVIGLVAFREDEEITVQVDEASIGSAGEIRVEGLSLKGGTEDGKSFSIYAATAAESTDEPNVVNLTGIEASITSVTGEVIEITAASGAYRRDAHTIRFDAGVAIRRPSTGLELEADAAFADLAGGVIKSDAKVWGSTPDGAIEAKGFEIREDSGDIKLFGRPRVVIE